MSGAQKFLRIYCTPSVMTLELNSHTCMKTRGNVKTLADASYEDTRIEVHRFFSEALNLLRSYKPNGKIMKSIGWRKTKLLSDEQTHDALGMHRNMCWKQNQLISYLRFWVVPGTRVYKEFLSF